MSVKGMRSSVRANKEQLDKVMLTLELTMPLKEWREIEAGLNQSYPHGVLGDKINQAIKKIFEPLNQVTDFGSTED